MDPTLIAILASSLMTLVITVISRVRKLLCCKPGHGVIDIELKCTPPPTPETVV